MQIGRETQYIIDCMTDAGLSVEIDDFGNVIGYKIGKKPDLPVVMVGSHTDSAPNGGNYDECGRRVICH